MVAPATVEGSAQQQASAMNSLRVNAVADRLVTHIQQGSAGDPRDFFRLCLSLARGIDYAVANNEVPAKAEALPPLLKQICQSKNDVLFRAGVMVLMVSVKNACKLGWFADQESEVLCNLSNEVGSAFCWPRSINDNHSDLISTVKEILARFFPFMMLGKILACHEQKPGFEALAIDFHIAKNPTYTNKDKICLFVAHKDSIETSACLISPKQVSFMLNGVGVKYRNNMSMISGPQMPSNVCAMLKYGTNLLQAIGQFSGHYIIFVAFMRMLSAPDTPMLPEYVQSSTGAPDSDVDVVEGASRISLDCPISRKRIRTPVKGHSCKHLQSFDFHNYININSRTPSWRCPNCNQDVCYTDLRIDQNMVQVLKEVGDNVKDVIISEDGSWRAVFQSDEQSVHVHDKTLSHQNAGTRQQENHGFSDAAPDILDLTGDDNEMEAIGCEIEDKKPIMTNPQSPSAATNITAAPNLNNASALHLSVGAEIDESFWSRFDLNSSGASSASQAAGSILESSLFTNMTTSLLNDVISPALNQEIEIPGNAFVGQSQIIAPTNTEFAQLVNGIEYGRLSQIPRSVSRTPVAVQALPLQSQTPSPQQRLNNFVLPNTSSMASFQATPSIARSANGFGRVSSDMERQQMFSRSHASPVHMHGRPSSLLHHQSAVQVGAFANVPLTDSRSRASPVHMPGMLSSPQHQSAVQNWNHQDTQSTPVHRATAPGLRPSLRSQMQTQQGQVRVNHAPNTANSSQSRFMLAPPRTAQTATVPVQFQSPRMAQTTTVTAQIQSPRTAPPQYRNGQSATSELVTNWQPARMRGSLLPGSYSAALDSLIIRPTQPSQIERPVSQSPLPPTQSAQQPSRPPGIPPNWQQRH